MTLEIAPPVAAPSAPSVAPAKAAPANEKTASDENSNTPEKSKTAERSAFMAILATLEKAPSDGLSAGSFAVPADAAPVDANAPSDISKGEAAELQSQDATSLVAQALQWMAPLADAAAQRAEEGAGVSPVGAGTPMLTPTATVFGPKSNAPLTAPSVLKADAGLDTPKPLNALAASSSGAQGQMDTAALQSLPVATAPATGKEGARTEGRDMQPVQTESFARAVPLLSEAVAALPSGLAKREEPGAARGAFQSAPVHDVAVMAGSPGWATGGAITSAVASTEGVTTTRSAIAEQVAYWISNDVQKAEMKLEGLGDSPVEVSISMNGNQAHVAFRTDEVQARDALENAGVQLKEMLQRDGVVLSGMSVGTSAGGDAGAGAQQDRSARQGVKNMTVLVDSPARTERSNSSKSGVGRALDLFV